MTVSSPQPNSGPETKLTDERAVTIGWFFIHSYYDFYNNKIENIHKIYNKLASISHSKFPTAKASQETNEIYKAKGIEAIKLRFKNDDVLDKNANRIVITNAAFEVSLDKNLLIVVFGEWSKNNSQYYQFTQTFLLTPAPGANDERFDVANDILRFNEVDNIIKSVEESKEETNHINQVKETNAEKAETGEKIENTEKVEVAEKTSDSQPKLEQPEAKPEATNTDESEEKSDKTSESKPSEPKVSESKSEPITEPVEDKSESVPLKKSTQEVAEPTETKSSEKSPTPTNSSPSTTTSSTTTPAAPLSWAALASQAAAKSTKPTPPVAPTPSVTKPQPVKKSSAPTTNKFKKEEWFPIYIRGVKTINEKRLRDVLSKSFGELKFFRTNLDIALVDFVTQEAQQDALNAKEIKIDGITISLEPRGSKTGNNYHNTGKKQKDQKSSFQSTSDLKRNKSDKKSNNINPNLSKPKNTPKRD